MKKDTIKYEKYTIDFFETDTVGTFLKEVIKEDLKKKLKSKINMYT